MNKDKENILFNGKRSPKSVLTEGLYLLTSLSTRSLGYQRNIAQQVKQQTLQPSAVFLLLINNRLELIAS